MTRDEAIARLKQSESMLKQAGVTHLYLFGSTVRDEARPDSDVDLFFDYEREDFGIFDLMDVKELAADIKSFVDTGKPTPDLYRTDAPADIHRIVTEPGKAVIVSSQP